MQRCDVCGKVINGKPYDYDYGCWTVCSEACAEEAQEIEKEKQQMEELMKEKR